MNRYRIAHITEFSYDALVSESYNEVRLRPRQDDLQSCLSFRLTTDPPSKYSAHIDYNDNWVHRFNILHEHRCLRVQAESVVLVQLAMELPVGGIGIDRISEVADEIEKHYDLLAATEFVPHAAALSDLARRAEHESDGTIAGFARTASAIVNSSFRYEKGATHVHSSIHDALATGAGVCQDFTHILLAMIRMRGIPCRYVSGYLVPRRTAEPGASEEEVIGGQASHAWIEVFIPNAGWFGLDPTLGVPVGLQHVRVAYGRDYGDVAPVRGVYKGHAGQRLSVDVCVRPALDDEGHEHLKETTAAPLVPNQESPAHQQAQQQ